MAGEETILVDVIVPVHNASETLRETIRSAMEAETADNYKVKVCCYSDGSTDDSLKILRELQKHYQSTTKKTQILIGSSTVSRGAGFARNRAVELHTPHKNDMNRAFLCLLDSDDTMEPSRIMDQVEYLMQLGLDQRHRTLVGSHFTRIPVTATEHYTAWANSLSDDRLYLECYREVTIIQPTWMMTRQRFQDLGGYVEAPLTGNTDTHKVIQQYTERGRLVHSTETIETLRVAEDLRFFHEHLMQDGLLKVIRKPLVMYRHRHGMSQSSSTPRKLLLKLRVLALERTVLSQTSWDRFVVWGAGRDGKDFCKALSETYQKKVYCMVDVDDQKIARGYYRLETNSNSDNNNNNKKDRSRFHNIPILHFSVLTKDPVLRDKRYSEWKERRDIEAAVHLGRIQKCRDPPPKRPKLGDRGMEYVHMELLAQLPVVVCVAMYRTNGVLEANVKGIGRTEGVDLWHCC